MESKNEIEKRLKNARAKIASAIEDLLIVEPSKIGFLYQLGFSVGILRATIRRLTRMIREIKKC